MTPSQAHGRRKVRDEYTLIIGGIPPQCGWQDLKDEVRERAPHLKQSIIYNGWPGPGLGHVNIKNEGEARRAFDMFKREGWRGHTVRVVLMRRSGTAEAVRILGPTEGPSRPASYQSIVPSFAPPQGFPVPDRAWAGQGTPSIPARNTRNDTYPPIVPQPALPYSPGVGSHASFQPPGVPRYIDGAAAPRNYPALNSNYGPATNRQSIQTLPTSSRNSNAPSTSSSRVSAYGASSMAYHERSNGERATRPTPSSASRLVSEPSTRPTHEHSARNRNAEPWGGRRRERHGGRRDTRNNGPLIVDGTRGRHASVSDSETNDDENGDDDKNKGLRHITQGVARM